MTMSRKKRLKQGLKYEGHGTVCHWLCMAAKRLACDSISWTLN